MFFDLANGFPRSGHYARILENKAIFEKTDRGDLVAAPEDVIQNVRVVT